MLIQLEVTTRPAIVGMNPVAGAMGCPKGSYEARTPGAVHQRAGQHDHIPVQIRPVEGSPGAIDPQSCPHC
jgi:hypothetical protein